MSDRLKYKQLLDTVLEKAQDISAVAIVLRNGLIVDSKIRAHLENDEIIGAMTALFDNFAKRVQEEFSSGESFTNQLSVDRFKILFVGAGQHAIVTVVSSLDANDDLIKFYGQILAKKVDAIIDQRETDLSLPDYESPSAPLPRGIFAYKIVMLGAPAVGKTSLVSRYLGKEFDPNYIPTANVNISEKRLELGDGCIMNLNIWDMQSQLQQFSPLRKRFFSDAGLAVIQFDLTRKETFEQVNFWLKNMRSVFKKKVPLVIVANKQDLDNHQVSEEEIKAKAEALGCKYIRCSAQNNENVFEVFRLASMEFLKATNAL